MRRNVVSVPPYEPPNATCREEGEVEGEGGCEGEGEGKGERAPKSEHVQCTV